MKLRRMKLTRTKSVPVFLRPPCMCTTHTTPASFHYISYFFVLHTFYWRASYCSFAPVSLSPPYRISDPTLSFGRFSKLLKTELSNTLGAVEMLHDSTLYKSTLTLTLTFITPTLACFSSFWAINYSLTYTSAAPPMKERGLIRVGATSSRCDVIDDSRDFAHLARSRWQTVVRMLSAGVRAIAMATWRRLAAKRACRTLVHGVFDRSNFDVLGTSY